MSAIHREEARRKPLNGKTVLVTRAKQQAPELSRPLRNAGARVIEIPLIEIAPPSSQSKFEAALRRLGQYDWLILTSVNGVEALFGGLQKLRLSPSVLQRVQVAAIGPATRAAVEKKGLRVAVMPREYVAEAVVKALRSRIAGRRVLLLRAAVARDVIPRELRGAGAKVTVVAAYQTKIPAKSREQLQGLLKKRAPDVITFTSSSTVRNFARLAGSGLYSGALDGTVLASIGPITSSTLREHRLRPAIQAHEYTMKGLVEAIKAWAQKEKAKVGSRPGGLVYRNG